MKKIERKDIRTMLSEMYDFDDDPRIMIDPVSGEEINIDIARFDADPGADEMRAKRRKRREENPLSRVDVEIPSEDKFDKMMTRRRQRRLSRSKLREMIKETLGDYHNLASQDVEGLVDDDILQSIEAMSQAAETLLLSAAVNPDKVKNYILNAASDAGQEPYDYVVGLGIHPTTASNIMGIVGVMDQAKMGMTFG